MTDSKSASKALQHGLVEDLGHEAELFVDDDRLTVGDSDACRFLTSMLEGIEGVVSKPGNILTGGIYPYDAASVLRLSCHL